MRRIVIVDYGKQDQKVNPKFYPLIWIALIFASLFMNVYAMTTTYSSGDLKGVAIFTQLLYDVLLGGLFPSAILYLIASLFYRSLAKRGLLQIPRKDFIYITMLFIAGARFVIGIVRIFSFLDPMMEFYTLLYPDILIQTVALYLEFFLVLAPKYLNPVQESAHFHGLSKIYTILVGVLAVVVLGGVFLAIEGFKIMLNEGTNVAEFGDIVFTVNGEQLTENDVIEVMGLFEGPLSVVAYVMLGVGVAVVATHFILDYLLGKKAKEYRKTHPGTTENNFGTGFYANGTNYYTGRPYDGGNQNPFDNGGNPYGNGGNPFAENNDNPFAERNPFGEDFDNTAYGNKNDDNPFGDY